RPGQSESVIGTSMSQSDVDRLVLWRHANIASDGQILDHHPRGAGAFTKVLREYVRERRLLPLEEAVRKMTSAPAAVAGLRNRGIVKVGAYADLVMFDPATISDRATLADPFA